MIGDGVGRYALRFGAVDRSNAKFEVRSAAGAR
jgi:hypothetical protein